MDRILFVIGIAFAAFLYGAATVKFQIPPHQWLHEARLGWEAWGAIERDLRNFPNNFEQFEDGAPAAPQARALAQEAGEERILVTGGPYEMMDRCPTWGCMAWVADRSGNVLHTWEVNLDELWKDLKGFSGEVNNLALYPVGMALGADGSLVITFQGRDTYPIQIGIAKIDRAGRIVWKRFDHSSHWIAVDPKGLIYTPYSLHIKDFQNLGGTGVQLACASGESNIDRIRVLSDQGAPVRELPILENLVQAGYRGLLYSVRDGCDPLHLNSIDIATPEIAARIPGAKAGDLLVSLREMNTVALLDGETGAVKRALTGRTAAQHGVRFLPDGTALGFDNMGGDRALGGSRVVRIDLVHGTAHTVFPRGGMESDSGVLPFFSQVAGHIDVSADGKRALVAVTHQGRLLEIDVASGKPLWVYDNTHDIAPFLKRAGLTDKRTRARFAAYGAYYVRNASFLKEKS
jgi:hypothetical protein